MKQPKIIITGPGRSGTTVLVKLLTLLGLPTGFTERDFKSIAPSGGGLEFYCTGPNQGPQIVKAPQYWNMLPKMAEWYDVKMVILPIRDLHNSAASRAALPAGSPGSLWGATNQKEQEDHNARVVYQIVRDCTILDIPLVRLDFPRIVTDPQYLWYYVEKITYETGVMPEIAAFRKAFYQVMNPAKIKQYPK